jgi:DNA-directed RNA polymerase specialized sigma24 family protein
MTEGRVGGRATGDSSRDAMVADLVRHLTLVLRNREAAEAVAVEAVPRARRARGSLGEDERHRELLGRGLRLGLARLRVGRLRRWLGATPIPEVARPSWLPAGQIGLWHDLGTLHPGLRAALLLGLLDGYSTAEVARMLEVTPGTAGAWLVTARLQLNPQTDANANATPGMGAHVGDDELRAELLGLEQSIPLEVARGDRYRSSRSWAALLRSVATLFAVTVVTFVGIRLLAGGNPGADESSVGPIARVSPSESTEPVPSESLPPIPSEIRWNATPFKASALRGAANVGGRWIVTGRNGRAAAAWFSDNLADWRPASITGATVSGQFAEMGAVAAHGNVLVAMGSSSASVTTPAAHSLAWISTDRGASWQPITLPAVRGALTSVAAGPSGFVAVTGWRGCCGSQTPATVLISADGRRWRAVTVAGLGGAMLNGVAGDGKGYVLVGQETTPTATSIGRGTQPRAWTSADGVQWTPVELKALEGAGQAAITVSGSPWGFVAAGLAGESDTGSQGIVIWVSTDGANWSDPTPVADAPNPDALVLAEGPNRVTMEIGLAEAPGQSLSTIDGTDWWPDDAPPQIHSPVLAMSDHEIVVASNCAAYLSDCPGPVLFTGTFDPEPAQSRD